MCLRVSTISSWLKDTLSVHLCTVFLPGFKRCLRVALLDVHALRMLGETCENEGHGCTKVGFSATDMTPIFFWLFEFGLRCKVQKEVNDSNYIIIEYENGHTQKVIYKGEQKKKKTNCIPHVDVFACSFSFFFFSMTPI